MKLLSPDTDAMNFPYRVRVLRTLGRGRAAQANLVDATMPDGRVVRCVEKVFTPGLLTRAIYRLSFQSPFAYRSNFDAVLACFYRRRVAAAVLAVSDIGASVASPLYVRYDEESRAWVLAAQWVDGRGVRPASADGSRIWCWLFADDATGQRDEIEELVDTMRRLERLFVDSGLVGSGWQVAPRALVSTANLLRIGDRYTIIDLESGIPAVLVPRYLFAGLRNGAFPPFDELDAGKLQSWLKRNDHRLLSRVGAERLATLQHDCQKLIEHSTRWKDSELALLRRPWRLFLNQGLQACRAECFRRWQQDGVVDADTASSLVSRPVKSRLIWYAGLLPSSLGRFCSRLIGRKDYRDRLSAAMRDPVVRHAEWRRLIDRKQAGWTRAGRIAPTARLTTVSFLVNMLLQRVTPAALHRFLVDGENRVDVGTTLLLLLFSRSYQESFGKTCIEASIDCWEERDRISAEEADSLRQDLSGREVRAYTRGFGMHLALKAFTPVVLPAKVGGVAAFFASGNPWFLFPLLLTPLMRTAVTLASWWSVRHEQIPHREAMAFGCLPVVGSAAFPLQMFSTRSHLSTFLIRDAASKIGRRLPVYGGADSRTEIAMIRMTDFLVELMQLVSLVAQGFQSVRPHRQSADEVRDRHHPARTRFGRWVDAQAAARMVKTQSAVFESQSHRHQDKAA